MSLIQGGPPEWIWERPPDTLKWEVLPKKSFDGKTIYELRVNCGLEVMRLQFFTPEEIKKLAELLAGLAEYSLSG